MKLYKQEFEGYCGPTKEFKAFFEEFGVAPIIQGIAKQGEYLMELWKTSSGDFWSIVLSKPDGTSCLISMGSDFMELIWFLPGPGA